MKTMKIWLLFLAVMMVAISAHARKNNDPEMRHVRLTMMDGKQVEGYIPKKYIPQFGIKKKVRNLVVSNIFRIFVVVNQIVTNNIKRLPNDYQGQSYRNILYYR